MKHGKRQRPAEESLRRSLTPNRAIRGACAAAAVFGALNLTAALFGDSTLVVDILALITLVAGATGVAGIRLGAFWTFAAMAIYLVTLLALGLAVTTGQAVSITGPDWLPVDARIFLLVAALWCAACLVVLYFGMRQQRWEGFSGTK